MAGLGIAQPRNPDFSGNPLGALGFALQSLSAGIRGDELPIEKYRRDQQSAEQERLKSASDHLVIMNQARDALQGLPEEQRGPIVDELTSVLGEDSRPMLETLSSTAGAGLSSPDFKAALDLTGGDRKLASKLLAEPSFRQTLVESRDQQQLGSVRAKSQSILQALGNNVPKGPSGLPSVSPDTLLTFSNALPDADAMKLTQQEIPTFERQWKSLAGDLGLETPDVRTFAQKEQIRTRNDLTVKAAGAQGASPEKPSFGSSEEGLALNTLLQYKQALTAGQITPDLEDKARVAAHILQQQKFLRTPEGDILSSTPGIPAGFPVPGASKNPDAAANPTAEILGTGPTLSKAQLPASDNKQVGMAIQAIDDAAGILDQASKSGETITGAVGQAKALGGGVARQLGFPVSDLARQLRTKVEEVKALAAKAVLGESGRSLSDADRKRLDTLMGTIDYTMDDTALRGSLAEVLKLLEKAQSGSGGGASAAGSEPTAVKLGTGERIRFHNGQWIPDK